MQQQYYVLLYFILKLHFCKFAIPFYGIEMFKGEILRQK